MAKVPVNFRIDEELITQVRKLSEQTGQSQIEIVERALKIGLREGVRAARLLENDLVRALIESVLSLDPNADDDLDGVRRAIEHIKKQKAKEVARDSLSHNSMRSIQVVR